MPALDSLLNSPKVSDWLDFTREGYVAIKTGKVEFGQGILTALLQIVAEELNVPLEKIFDRVIIVLTGLDLQYDAIAFALYDTSVSTMASATGDVLLPAFYANPNTYKNANPNSILYTLHPNYSIASSNASEGDYKQAVDSICLEMSGANSRVPASIGGDTPANSQKALSARQGLWGLIWQALLSMLDSIGSR